MERLFFWRERKPPVILIEEEIRETWGVIQERTLEERWVFEAVNRANSQCFQLLQQNGPLSDFKKEGGIQEPTEWQILYASLMERLLKVDQRLGEGEWRYIARTIDSVKQGIFKKFNMPLIKGVKWLETLENAAQMIVFALTDKAASNQIPSVVKRFAGELAQIRG